MACNYEMTDSCKPLTQVLLLCLQMMEVQKASAGKLLQGVGSEAKFLYVVHKGTVSVTNTGLQGKHQTWLLSPWLRKGSAAV
jgi:hypothetical protein